MTSRHPADAKCITCGQTHPLADGSTPRHPFNDGTLSVAATFGTKQKSGVPLPEVEVKEASWPFDPVLRQALINLGVITPQDLSNAEAQIRAVTAQWEKVTSDDSSRAAGGA